MDRRERRPRSVAFRCRVLSALSSSNTATAMAPGIFCSWPERADRFDGPRGAGDTLAPRSKSPASLRYASVFFAIPQWRCGSTWERRRPRLPHERITRLSRSSSIAADTCWRAVENASMMRPTDSRPMQALQLSCCSGTQNCGPSALGSHQHSGIQRARNALGTHQRQKTKD